MADVKLNALIEGLSGKVGKNVVMRQREGRTFLSTRPKGAAIISAKQQAQRDRFQKAVDYGKIAIQTPAVKAEYEAIAKQQAFISPYTAAVTDYLTEPKIAKIEATGYKGMAGDLIRVIGTADFKLFSVNVAIQLPDGTLLESGDATASGTRLDWSYVATQNIAPEGLKIVVTATDRPGNVVVKELVI